MELIKYTRSETVNNKKKKLGLFKCGKCGKIVERGYYRGVSQKSCGCTKFCDYKKIDKNKNNLILISSLTASNKKSLGYFYCVHCGNHRKMMTASAMRAKSCGCKGGGPNGGIVRHNKHKEKIYKVWQQIIGRCTNKNHPEYFRYGERGIKVCDEWRDFVNFDKWSNSVYKVKNSTIDRINNNDGYHPGNCHFVSTAQNSRNTRRNVTNWAGVHIMRSFYSTGMFTHKRLSEIFNMSKGNVRAIINYITWRDK